MALFESKPTGLLESEGYSSNYELKAFMVGADLADQMIAVDVLLEESSIALKKAKARLQKVQAQQYELAAAKVEKSIKEELRENQEDPHN